MSFGEGDKKRTIRLRRTIMVRNDENHALTHWVFQEYCQIYVEV